MVIILTLTAIITVWVYAAFVEPTAGPNDSDQDFAQNILGANNADNDFDLSAVTTNKDGSIVERLEYITNRMTTAGEWYSTECGESTTTTKTNCYVDDTAKYVNANACVNSANTGYCYMNTATFSAMDADLAAGNIVSGKTIFGVAGTADQTCYWGANPQTTNWGIGSYGCVGSNQRCYSGSCITCGGWMNADYCWYSGVEYDSCTTVCSTRGGVYGDDCNWVNDPADCSTCLHYFPEASCQGIDSVNHDGPHRTISNSRCYYHEDGITNCGNLGGNISRQCACNQQY